MKVQKVLVTGGAGFIGSRLVRELLQSGYSVHVLDNLSVGKRENVPQAFHGAAEHHFQHHAERERFFGAAKLVAGITLLSRLAGLARDLVQAWIFGARFTNDAFNTAFAMRVSSAVA